MRYKVAVQGDGVLRGRVWVQVDAPTEADAKNEALERVRDELQATGAWRTERTPVAWFAARAWHVGNSQVLPGDPGVR